MTNSKQTKKQTVQTYQEETDSLESAVRKLFRNRARLTISQATSYLKDEPQFRYLASNDVRDVIFAFETEGYLARDNIGGITRFFYTLADIGTEPAPKVKAKAKKKTNVKLVYTVSAGRTIDRDGVPMIRINRLDDWKQGKPVLTPVEADELTHRICAFLNTEGK